MQNDDARVRSEPGSRAGTEPVCAVSALSGFDPSRLADELREAAYEIEGWGAGNEAATVRHAVKAVEALIEAVYVIRNAAGTSEWYRRHASRHFDYEDFCVWAEHWERLHPIIGQIGAADDRRIRDSDTRRMAETVQQGSERSSGSAGRNGIAERTSHAE